METQHAQRGMLTSFTSPSTVVYAGNPTKTSTHQQNEFRSHLVFSAADWRGSLGGGLRAGLVGQGLRFNEQNDTSSGGGGTKRETGAQHLAATSSTRLQPCLYTSSIFVLIGRRVRKFENVCVKSCLKSVYALARAHTHTHTHTHTQYMLTSNTHHTPTHTLPHTSAGGSCVWRIDAHKFTQTHIHALTHIYSLSISLFLSLTHISTKHLHKTYILICATPRLSLSRARAHTHTHTHNQGIAYDGIVHSFIPEACGFKVVYDDGSEDLCLQADLQDFFPEENIYVLPEDCHGPKAFA